MAEPTNYDDDAWKRLQDLWDECSRAWKVRVDLEVTARGPDRGVELILWDAPTDDRMVKRSYQSTGSRNVGTMRQLALAIWAACDFVEEKNPGWATRLPRVRPVEASTDV